VLRDELWDAVRAAVAARQAADEREVASKARILSELDRLPFPLDEHADPTHITGSAIVVGARGTVLHLHRRMGIWLQPGGHVERGETPWDAARRETVEETGLAARHPDTGPELVHVDVHPAPRGHEHLDLRYLLLAPGDDPSPAAGESPDARWFSWDEASAVADESLRHALRAARHAAGLSPSC
jgi:8-oxo-dGTP pyrophosphatase MutT (NUDIX family)